MILFYSQDEDPDKWLFTSRFFMVDPVTSRETHNSEPKIVR